MISRTVSLMPIGTSSSSQRVVIISSLMVSGEIPAFLRIQKIYVSAWRVEWKRRLSRYMISASR